MNNSLWTPCPAEEFPSHMIEWIDLHNKALKLGFPHKSGHISKEELIDYIKENS